MVGEHQRPQISVLVHLEAAPAARGAFDVDIERHARPLADRQPEATQVDDRKKIDSPNAQRDLAGDLQGPTRAGERSDDIGCITEASCTHPGE
jgi:hypothetical protein